MSRLQDRVLLIGAVLAFLIGIGTYSFISEHISYALDNARAASNTASPGDWPMYQYDPGRSGFNAAETTITPANASKLKLHWTNTAGGSATSQVAAVNGTLYWGSWDGIEHATNLSGTDIWKANLGQTTDSACNPPTVGVASTAAVATVTIAGTATSVVFVGGGNSVFYALNASTGAILWQTPLGTPPSYFLWSSPIVYNGSVYEGVSSFGDCPLIRGEIVKMDASTGTIQNTFYTMPSGCLGASVWSSPAIDSATGIVYISTGNAKSCSKAGQYFFSVVALHASDLSLVQFWQIPPSDRFGDDDFGATPTLFTATIGGVLHDMVGVLNKNGKYYAFNRATLSSGPVWETQVGTTGAAHNISSSTFDGTNLYIASDKTTIGGVSCMGSVNAVKPANGNFVWRLCQAQKAECPLVSAPGLLIVGQGPYMRVFATSNGATLFTYHEPVKNGIFRSPIISNGIIYITNDDGHLEAFGL